MDLTNVYDLLYFSGLSRQGTTLIALVGMAGLSTIPSAGDKILDRHAHAAEHSWKDFIGDTESDPSVSRH